jgi:hypothetical protein
MGNVSSQATGHFPAYLSTTKLFNQDSLSERDASVRLTHVLAVCRAKSWPSGSLLADDLIPQI